MARAKITTYAIGLNGVSAEAVTPVEIVAANGAYGEYLEDGTLYTVTNTTSGESAADITLKVKANTGNDSDDKSILVEDGDTLIIGNFESARYKQADGTIHFDASANGLTMYGEFQEI